MNPSDCAAAISRTLFPAITYELTASFRANKPNPFHPYANRILRLQKRSQSATLHLEEVAERRKRWEIRKSSIGAIFDWFDFFL